MAVKIIKKKSELGLPLTKQAVSILVEPFEPLVMKAIELIESKDPAYFTNAGVKQVVVESETGDHLGKVQSDQPDTIFVSVNKIKSFMGANQSDEEAIVRQIALTLSHEKGHISDKMQHGEQPAITEEQNMNAKLSKNQQAKLLVIAAEELGQMELRLKRLTNQINAGRERKDDLAAFKDYLELKQESRHDATIKLRHVKTKFNYLSPDQVQAEIDRLSTALAAAEKSYEGLAAEYTQLTGKIFAGPGALDIPSPVDFGVPPPPPAVVEKAPAAPVEPLAPGEAPPVVVPSAEIPTSGANALADESEEEDEELRDSEVLDPAKLFATVEKKAERQIFKGITYDKSGKAEGAESDLPSHILATAFKMMHYVLDTYKGNEALITDFLAPNQLWKGMPADEANELIKDELDKKKMIFETYKDQIVDRHRQLAKLKGDRPNYRFTKNEIKRQKEDLMKLEVSRHADPAVVEQKRNAIKSLEEDTKEERELRRNLRIDRDLLANQLANTINRIIKAPRSQLSTYKPIWDKDLKEQVQSRTNKSDVGQQQYHISLLPSLNVDKSIGTLWSTLKPEEREKWDAMLEKAKKKEREGTTSGMPKPGYTGYSSDAARWSGPPGEMSAIPAPAEKQEDISSYDRQSKGPAPKLVVRKKKSDLEIPLLKSAAEPFDPSDPEQTSKSDARATEGKEKANKAQYLAAVKDMIAKMGPMNKAVIEKLKANQPLSPVERTIFKRIKEELEQVKVRLGYESGSDRPFGAPTDEEKEQNLGTAHELNEADLGWRGAKREIGRKQRENALVDELKGGPTGGSRDEHEIVKAKAAKLAEAEALWAKWKADLKAMPKKGLKKVEKQQLMAKLYDQWRVEFAKMRGPRQEGGKANWLPPDLAPIDPSRSSNMHRMIAELKRHIRDLSVVFDSQQLYTKERRMGIPHKKTTPQRSQQPFAGKPPAATDDLSIQNKIQYGKT